MIRLTIDVAGRLVLYAQCAATPDSAVACMSRVRIWNSIILPPGAMTVVWRLWYRLDLGIAM
jgi:hypothetical protein